MIIRLLLFIVLYNLIIYLSVVARSPDLRIDTHIPITVHMPEVSNLEVQEIDKYDLRKIDKYVDEVILPSHDYFKLKKDIEEKIRSSESNSLISVLFSLFTSLIWFIRFFRDLDLSDFLTYFLAIACPIALNVLALILSLKIYEYKGKIRDCYLDRQWFERNREASNIDIIIKHKEYLEDIKNSIFRRHTGSVVLATMAFVSYALYQLFLGILINS